MPDMGFNKVYKSLLEVFPQIDGRALRAVAIEHSKDADAAVEAVLLEIIPFFTKRSRPWNPLTRRSVSVEKLSEGLVADTQTADDGRNEPFYDAYDGRHEREDTNIELMLSKEIEKCSTDKCHKISCDKVETLEEDIDVNQNINLIPQTENYVQLETEFSNAANKESNQEKSSVDDNSSITGHTPPTVDDLTRSPSFVVLPDMLGSDIEKLESSLSSDYASKLEATSNIVGLKNESSLTAATSESSHIHIINVLEEIIADARNNKKTLVSAMQSAISLMREVELKERAGEQAKLESTLRETEIQVKVQELKQMLRHAKEANDMHAGEVYGEKAILATELKELQSRLLSLSDERDKSLAVLDEMRQTLEVRLATAENEIKSFEQEKLEKEKAAAITLVDLELVMQKVEQESNILKQQAEDNAKLQQFLMDRGRVVDLLQGEIVVISHDVNLLKEKFDEYIPFSKSLSSSQTSFILASSTSSFKSLIPDQVEPVPDEAHLLKTQKKKDLSDQQPSEEKAAKDYRKVLQDDGWEFFDNGEIYV